MTPRPGSLKKTAVFTQSACLQHRYIRSQDLSNIVERPERLRAVHIGLAAAIARLEELLPDALATSDADTSTELGDLAAALDKLNLMGDSPADGSCSGKIQVVQSEAKVDILDNAAVKFVHGDIDGDVYLETLRKWVEECAGKVAQGESEIPEGYSQGDLYCTCPFFSLQIVQG